MSNVISQLSYFNFSKNTQSQPHSSKFGDRVILGSSRENIIFFKPAFKPDLLLLLLLLQYLYKRRIQLTYSMHFFFSRAFRPEGFTQSMLCSLLKYQISNNFQKFQKFQRIFQQGSRPEGLDSTEEFN